MEAANQRSCLDGKLSQKKFVKQKELLELLGRKESALLSDYLKEIVWNDGTNREGHAAKVYFNALFGLDFTRTEDSLLMRLKLWLFYFMSAFAREIVASGYLTQIGIFHDNMFNQFNLASDLWSHFGYWLIERF